MENSHKLYTINNIPSYETLRNQALYNITQVSSEKIKITQMERLNKIKELGKNKQKLDKQDLILDPTFQNSEKPEKLVKSIQSDNVNISVDLDLESSQDIESSQYIEDTEDEDDDILETDSCRDILHNMIFDKDLEELDEIETEGCETENDYDED